MVLQGLAEADKLCFCCLCDTDSSIASNSGRPNKRIVSEYCQVIVTPDDSFQDRVPNCSEVFHLQQESTSPTTRFSPSCSKSMASL